MKVFAVGRKNTKTEEVFVEQRNKDEKIWNIITVFKYEGKERERQQVRNINFPDLHQKSDNIFFIERIKLCCKVVVTFTCSKLYNSSMVKQCKSFSSTSYLGFLSFFFIYFFTSFSFPPFYWWGKFWCVKDQDTDKESYEKLGKFEWKPWQSNKEKAITDSLCCMELLEWIISKWNQWKKVEKFSL